jgi:hypothetical protein
MGLFLRWLELQIIRPVDNRKNEIAVVKKSE